METLGSLSPRALAAFLDDYEPPEEGLLGPVDSPVGVLAAQEALDLQETELRALLAAQSSDLSGCSTGPPLVPPAATTAASSAHPPKKLRTYNPNRARAEQRKELAGLREQVPRLEQVLGKLKWRSRRNKRAGAQTGVLAARSDVSAWREVAACRRELREQAELENARLRAVVTRQLEIAKRMQQILQTRHRYQGMLDRAGLDASATDSVIFVRLLDGAARSFGEVDAVLVAYSDSESAAAVPFEVTVRHVGDGAGDGQVTSWRYFARPMKDMPRRAYQQEQEGGTGDGEPAVAESCGVQLYAAGTESCGGGHVCQYIRKNKERGRIVIAWGSFAAAAPQGEAGSRSDVAFFTSRCPHSDRCFRRHQASARGDMDAVLQPHCAWDVLTRGGGARHREAHGESLEVTARKAMPFGVRATGEAAWQYFAHALEHVNYRFYYQTRADSVDVADDMIIEGFQLELQANGRPRARFKVHQVLRRLDRGDLDGDDGSVVLVWRAVLRPVGLGDRPVRGGSFYERGYVEIRRAAGGQALVQTCYLISPRWRPDASLAARDRRELADTVLSSTAANVTASYQMIESALAARH